MFHLLASIASPSQSNFDCGKASITKALVLILHRFFSKGFVVSIFSGGFNSSYRFFLLISLLARAHCFLIERVVVLGIAVDCIVRIALSCKFHCCANCIVVQIASSCGLHCCTDCIVGIASLLAILIENCADRAHNL